MTRKKINAESKRLLEYRSRQSNWKHWGPYLSERSWGTVREDYSPHGNAWEYFPHDHSRSRTYRWGEDGIGGISDRNQYLCFALAFWNGNDSILKERLFGLSGHEGNHGEDVKEYYYYTSSTPTHSYMKMLYKYPQRAFPYTELVDKNRHRPKSEPEFELVDTGIFQNDEYFDCEVEYAKASENDILVKITVHNHARVPAPIWILPTLWFRNTWSWGYPAGPMNDVSGKPQLSYAALSSDYEYVLAEHSALGNYHCYALGSEAPLFTENETNAARFPGAAHSGTRFAKDAFHHYFVDSNLDAVNPALVGTKACFQWQQTVPPQSSITVKLRLSDVTHKKPFHHFDSILAARLSETEEFYDDLQPKRLSDDQRHIQRSAFAGLLWTKQLYYFDLEQWTDGDLTGLTSKPKRDFERNREWAHLTNFDIISMPDKWEYPWYAAWDTAFHCVALAVVDPDFAKRQLELMTREWYMHPNGQIPAYEWAFGDVNPPVHAWATWRVYKIDSKATGKPDHAFLETLFHKLMLNFTWWVNQKDADGHNIFQGGFLGLDNIGVFDRSSTLPTGGHINQADGTSWMASYCLTMMKIAIELARKNPVYQDMASKFLEHFLRISHAMTNVGGRSLWDEADGFFYDSLHLPSGDVVPLKIRSLVGLIPLIAVDTIEPVVEAAMPDFTRRLKWFVKNRAHLAANLARMDIPGVGRTRLMALVTKQRLLRVLHRLFDENEFLSEYGLRSLSKFHAENPYELHIEGQTFRVGYEPAESTSGIFGGNSNWRGPIWFPTNLLIIEALQRFHYYYGAELKVEYPTHSGNLLSLEEIAADLSRRLCKLFLLDEQKRRPYLGNSELMQQNHHFRDHLLFHEYFHPDTGAGLGASHQTGWTALVAKLLQQSG